MLAPPLGAHFGDFRITSCPFCGSSVEWEGSLTLSGKVEGAAPKIHSAIAGFVNDYECPRCGNIGPSCGVSEDQATVTLELYRWEWAHAQRKEAEATTAAAAVATALGIGVAGGAATGVAGKVTEHVLTAKKKEPTQMPAKCKFCSGNLSERSVFCPSCGKSQT
jgi:hypothetical protein